MKNNFIILIAIGVAAAAPARAEKLGRLFFTPEQRAQLDYSYAQDAGSNNNNGHALTLNGIVQRQGGQRTVWINGVPQQVEKSREKTPDSQTVPLPGQRKSIKLKVGQRVLLTPSTDPGSE